MRTDDPRLEKSRKETTERVGKLNALTLAVLRAHLLVEQTMDEFLTASLFHPDHVRQSRFTFLHKAQLCRAMSLNENNDPVWEVLWQGNELRNTIAHSLSADEIKKKMDRLRETYINMLTDEQGKGLENQPDDFIAQSALLFCAGFLATLQDDAKSRRKVIDEHWKPRA